MKLETGLCLGYYPGVVGRIVALHGEYYHEHWGFDVTFETQVASELSEFVARFDPNRDGLWTVLPDRQFAGAIAIDGHKAETEGARLRWFIVAPHCHGKGLGSVLIDQALGFCRSRGFARVYLWTFRGLVSAARLYESRGFRLTEEHSVAQWGGLIAEQKFELDL
ncbi:MAG: GNAT family N-acetyltransferase [Thermodesulfobacteriota bacterium]